MTLLDDFWFPLGVVIGAILLTLKGYFSPGGRNGVSRATFSGAAVFDSSIARELVVEARRIADAMETIQKRLEQTAKDHDMEVLLERKINERERQRRELQTRGE